LHCRSVKLVNEHIIEYNYEIITIVQFNRYINKYELKWIKLNAVLYCGLNFVKQCVIMLYKIKALTCQKGKLNFTLPVTSVTGVNWIEVAVWTFITLNPCKVVAWGEHVKYLLPAPSDVTQSLRSPPSSVCATTLVPKFI